MCVKLTVFRVLVGSQHCRRHEDCSLGAPNLQPSAPLSFLLILFLSFSNSNQFWKINFAFWKNTFGNSNKYILLISLRAPNLQPPALYCLFFSFYFCLFLISNNLSVTSLFLIENMESYECIITSAVPPPTKFFPKKPTRISLLCFQTNKVSKELLAKNNSGTIFSLEIFLSKGSVEAILWSFLTRATNNEQ